MTAVTIDVSGMDFGVVLAVYLTMYWNRNRIGVMESE